jgi:hypothetical protein
MALNAPKIYLPDGTLVSSNINYSTNVGSILLSGVVDSNTIDVQIQVRGGGFASNPTLIYLNLPNFNIPNPASFPNGLPLVPGDNQIDVRSIDVSGNVSPITSIYVRYATEKELSLTVSQPTGLQLLRHKDSVTVVAAQNPETSIVGYNFYAAKESGGSVSGYYRINKNIVAQSESSVVDTSIYTDSIAYTHSDSFLKVVVSEVDNNDTLIRDIVTERIDLRGTVADQVLDLGITGKVVSYTYIFVHNRAATENDGVINNDQFFETPNDQPLYYVITAVGYDPRTKEYVESRYSSELVGLPLVIDTTIKDMPIRSRQDIILSEIRNIQRVNPTVSLIPGSTTRDVHIDPPSSELERVAFIADFIHRSQSYLTLLAIDDADGDGVSDPVSLNQYKRTLKDALFLTRDEDVQAIIDDAFDKRAGDTQTIRQGAQKAIGQAVFYTYTKPTKDMYINQGSLISTEANADLGIPFVNFEVTAQVVLRLKYVDSYYVISRKRWEITANIRASVAGSAGTRPANQIIKVVSGASGFSVINLEPTRWGYDQESNRNLAERAELAFSSVDSGTTGGYLAVAKRTVGVQEALVIDAGNKYMMRDWDDVRNKHIGGKVDVWVKGLNELEVSDSFSFQYSIVNNMKFDVVDFSNLIFRSTDTRLSLSNPITEMLDDVVKGYGFRNATKGVDFVLNDGVPAHSVKILDYRTIQLSTAAAQPAYDIDDLVTGDYRYQLTNTFVLVRQPVRRVVSVIGEISGSLDPDYGYLLYKTEDPLWYGESTKASDYVLVNQYNGVPSGVKITVNNEPHILIGTRQELLKSIGVDPATIRVFSADRTVEYRGPSLSSPDFLVVPGTSTVATKILRVSTGNISNGQEVSVDYEHDENFTVRYVVNDLLRYVQDSINKGRHTTADALVKQSIENAISLENTIVLKYGADTAQADSSIRTKVAQSIEDRPIGGGGRQSDIIRVEENVPGVDYVIVPFSKMAWSDGSLILRETVLSDYIELTSLNSGNNKVYLLISSLASATIDNCGAANTHRGVFQDSQPMVFAASLLQIAAASGQAFVIGWGGAIITGYSDDATLIAEGYTTTEEIETERKNRTANRVVLSLSFLITDLPTNHSYSCSYTVSNSSGAKDLVSSALSSVTLGDFNIIYTEET